MSVKEYKTKAEAVADLPILVALGAMAPKPEPRGWTVEAPGVDQAELEAVLAKLDGERRTPAVIRMAIKCVTGRTVATEGRGGAAKAKPAKDTTPALKVA